MKKFTSADDVSEPLKLVHRALAFKKSPLSENQLGSGLTLGLIFMNPSLRTRLSTQKAAQNLGMNVITLNTGQDGWNLETRDGIVMSGDKAEHIREAAAVIGQYCDILGIRSFPSLQSRDEDYEDMALNLFIQYSGIPVVSLESATAHPLQGLTDMATIEELRKKDRPTVVLTWAPHVKALPQSVPNSFVSWMKHYDCELIVTYPEGQDLNPEIMDGVKVEHDQRLAFENADFIYAKNWSSYSNYGKIAEGLDSWKIDEAKMCLTNNGKFMHCLPIRRNVVATDGVLDSDSSIVIQQAGNREFCAQAVLEQLINGLRKG